MLVPTKAYNLLEKRITKAMSAAKERDFHLYFYKCVMCVNVCFVSTSREIIRGIYNKIYVKDIYKRMLIKLEIQKSKNSES